MPQVDWPALLPQYFLGGGGLVLLTLGSLLRRRLPAWFATAFSAGAALGALGGVIWLWVRVQDPARGAFTTIADTIGIDGFSVFLSGVVAISVLLSAVLASGTLRRLGLPAEEFCVLLLLSGAGGVTMASANDLIVLFLGLEVLSISAYVLAALDLRRSQSQEAGLKYFLLGAFASAFFLYGVALLYGATGSTKLALVADFLAGEGPESNALLLGGMALLLVGLFFKVAAVPFHAWTPDVYEGSPPVAVAYMSAGVKAAGFAGLLRVFNAALGANAADWQPIVYAIAALTVLVGATLAVVQSDVRRLLAYSSISHAGFILVGVEAATDEGIAGSLFYLGVYAFLALGSFAVVTILGTDAGGRQSLDSYDGLAKRSPMLAAAFAVLLLAQAGVPFTTGFWAKLEVIGASVEARSFWLAAIAMLGAVVAAFLYLRIVVRMYLTAPVLLGRPTVSRSAAFVVAVCALATLVFGILPGPLVELTNDATVWLGS